MCGTRRSLMLQRLPRLDKWRVEAASVPTARGTRYRGDSSPE
jgi:hypothetical protein